MKVYSISRYKACKSGCCVTFSASAGFSGRAKFPIQGYSIPNTDNGLFGVIGGSLTAGLEAKVCDGNRVSSIGFVQAQGYGGVRVSFSLTPELTSKWIKAVGFAEAGAYAAYKHRLLPFQLESASAGGYIRARAEFSFGTYSRTYQYSHSWCLLGTCNGDPGDMVDD